MIGHQQAATGITGLKTTLQPEGATDENGSAAVVMAGAAENNAGAQENGDTLTADDAPKITNPALAGISEVSMPAAAVNSDGLGAPADNNEGDEKKEDEEEGEEPIDMSFPSDQGWQKILLYLFSFPLMAPLYVTLPDTKDKSSKCSTSYPNVSCCSLRIFLFN